MYRQSLVKLTFRNFTPILYFGIITSHPLFTNCECKKLEIRIPLPKISNWVVHLKTNVFKHSQPMLSF